LFFYLWALGAKKIKEKNNPKKKIQRGRSGGTKSRLRMYTGDKDRKSKKGTKRRQQQRKNMNNEFRHVLYDGEHIKWYANGQEADKQYIKMRFRVTLFFIYLFEVAALAWPIVATVLYTRQAILSWFWGFAYLLRIFLLIVPFVRHENIAAILGADGYHGWLNKFRIPAAFRPSFFLWVWAWVAVLFCGLFGSILTVFMWAAYPLYDSLVLYILSGASSTLFTLESVAAPFILYYHGVYYAFRASV